MKKNIAILIAAAAIVLGGGRVARAQWGAVYVFCGTPAGRGPTLLRPAGVVGQPCYLWFAGYGRVYGYWYLE
jgi:hypothetical protein